MLVRSRCLGKEDEYERMVDKIHLNSPRMRIVRVTVAVGER